MERLSHTPYKLHSLMYSLVLVGLLISPAGISGPGIAEATSASGPPNLLFIIMDDVGIDQMRAFGYSEDNQPRTPNIDAIARAGVRFCNAWAMPECSPSRVSFFMGRYPLRTGVLNISVTRDLANSHASSFEITTPRLLRTRGYKSGLFGKWHLPRSRVMTRTGTWTPETRRAMGLLMIWAGNSSSGIWREPHAPSIPPPVG